MLCKKLCKVSFFKINANDFFVKFPYSFIVFSKIAVCKSSEGKFIVFIISKNAFTKIIYNIFLVVLLENVNKSNKSRIVKRTVL